MIGIIDYDAGNIRSVEKALSYLGEKTVVSRDPDILKSVDKVWARRPIGLSRRPCRILPIIYTLGRQWKTFTDMSWFR